MKGLGVVTVAGLIGEVGDFTKFRTQSEIMKLAGLDLYEISSGKRKGQRRISKTGKEPSSEDPLQRGHLDHTKERDHVQLLYEPHRQGHEEDLGTHRHSQETPTDHPCDGEG